MGQRNERWSGKLLLPLLISVPVLLGLAIAAYYMWAAGEAKRSQALRDRIIWDARDLAALIQPSINHTRQLAGLIEQARAAGAERDIIKGLAVPTLDLRTEYLGVGVVFEPNGFDGRDAEYEGVFPENDRKGRFSAYYYRESGKPAGTTSFDMAEVSDTKAWYDAPMKTGRAALLVPFPYVVDGVDVSLSSVAVPMRDAGKSVGVTLIDFRMTDIAAKVQALTSKEIGGAWIVSADGRWIVHPDKAKIGASLALYDAGPEGDIEALRRQDGSAKSLHTRQGLNDIGYIMTPIPLDGVDQSWLLAVSVPPSDLADGMTEDVIQIVGAAIAILFVGSMILLEFWLSARRNKGLPSKTSRDRTAAMGAATSRNLKAKPRPATRRSEPTVRRR